METPNTTNETKVFYPWKTLLFILAILAGLSGISMVFPENGIPLFADYSLKFPNWKKYWKKEEVKKVDISKIIALAEAEEKVIENKKDTVAKKEIIRLVTDKSMLNVTRIQYKDTTHKALFAFFEALKNGAEDKSIRILHYGDSQIEGDRISDYLRVKLQQQFGGGGPGLLTAMPVSQTQYIKQEWSENWQRYGIFTSKDSRVSHKNFGVAAHFCRFTPFHTEWKDTISNQNAWLKIKFFPSVNNLLDKFNVLKIYYAGGIKKSALEFYEKDNLVSKDSLAAGGIFNIHTLKTPDQATELFLKLSAKDGPDIYGLSLERNKGVYVDNIALRGSSGTFFNQMNLSQLKLFYEELNVRLLILQFGGNTIPYTTDSLKAMDYGRYLQAQIVTLKKLCPNASILVIGPGDMSVKVGDQYETHPQLENVRNAIRQAAFRTDCAFFDMYDCMGGKNSMISWVEAGIAAKDYIHFSWAGARKIATLLYASLSNDYNTYLNQHP